MIETDLSENKLMVDVSRVFIPCRPILEMETMSSILMVNKNYLDMHKLIWNNPSPKEFCQLLEIKDEIFGDIVDRYYNVSNKLKPIGMRNRWQKTSQQHRRIGSVNAYSTSRIPLFFALDRLKIKYLLIKNFFFHLTKHNFDLSFYSPLSENVPRTTKDYLSDYYFHSSLKYFDIISPKKSVSANTRRMFSSRISSEMLRIMLSYVHKEAPNSGINYIMRGIKSSLFTCQFLFMKLDVPQPFVFAGDHMIDAEKIMIGSEFLPDLLVTISDALIEEKYEQLVDLFQAFDFMMSRVLMGINNAVKIASNQQINLTLNEIQYYVGDIFLL